jgi:hypothetical protein
VSEQVYPGQPLGGALGRVTLAPLQLAVTGEEWLRLVVSNAATGVTLSLTTRVLGSAPAPTVNRLDVIPLTNRSVLTKDLYPGVGAILQIGVAVIAGAPLVGQCFVDVLLIRGSGSAAQPIAPLFSGYITANQPMGWPGSPIIPSTTGEPVMRTIIGTTPAAGVNISEAVPTGARWQLLAFFTTLTTSAAAGNRGVQVSAFSGATVVAFAQFPQTQGPGVGVNYEVAQGMVQATGYSTTTFMMPWPSGLRLPAGTTIQTQTAALDAGDQYAAPKYTVLEWLEVS